MVEARVIEVHMTEAHEIPAHVMQAHTLEALEVNDPTMAWKELDYMRFGELVAAGVVVVRLVAGRPALESYAIEEAAGEVLATWGFAMEPGGSVAEGPGREGWIRCSIPHSQ